METKRDLSMVIGSKNEQIAYFMGAMMGDGSYSTADICVRPRVSFTSSDKDFAQLIRQLAEELFGIHMNLYLSKLSEKNPNWRDTYKMASRVLYKNLSFYLPDHKVLPVFIKGGDLKIKSAFVSGFFDAEGGVSISWIKSRKAIDRRIHCHNQNLGLLKIIKNYLNLIDIKNFIITYPDYYTLNVWGFSGCTLFRQKVGFKIQRKKDKLNELIKSYKAIHKRGNEVIYNMVIDLLDDTNNVAVIRKKLLDKGIELPQQTIERWIGGIRK